MAGGWGFGDMCGICGVISGGWVRPADAAAVRTMSRSMVHRGPDGEGILGGDGESPVMLAMRRLAIIDLEGGWQPLYNEDKSIAVVANGEVYNHIELRQSLMQQGHRFRTGSDCETIAHLYEQHGLDFVHHLRGMYAFALWDSRRNRLILGRDRMGEKPLYLLERKATADEPAKLFFGSELRTIVATGLVPFELDPGMVNLYFHHGYVPEPFTPLASVRKLPAGCLMIVDVDPRVGGFEAVQKRYWRLDEAPPVEGDPAKVVREELDRIGDLIVRSDVPVCVALSGGVDSSLVAAIAARHSPKQIRAITVGYKGRPRQDERVAAKHFAEHIQIPFHEVEAEMEEMIEMLPQRSVWRDDPIADIAGHGYYVLARESRRLGAPVLLQGHGGDELFWGYSWVREAVAQSQHKQAHGGASLLRSFKRMVPTAMSRRGMRPPAMMLASLLYGWGRIDPDAGTSPDTLVFENLTQTYQVGALAVRRIFTPQFAARMVKMDPTASFTVPKPWPQLDVLITRLICEGYLVENGMAQGDRLSMVSGVELRLPLCDYRLAELVVGMRKHAAARGESPDYTLPPKSWLREATKTILPEWVFNRPKRGFTAPGQDWMPPLVRAHAPALMDGYLVSNGIVSEAGAAKLNEHHSSVSGWTDIVYRTLVLEFWCRGVSRIASAGKSVAVPEAVVA